jgi:hypothetical protein
VHVRFGEFPHTMWNPGGHRWLFTFIMASV